MKMFFNDIIDKEVIDYNSTLDHYFDENSKVLKKINRTSGTISFDKAHNTIVANIKLKLNCKVVSSYTNIPFDQDIRISDTICFTNKKDQACDEIILVDDEINFDDFIYSLILTSIPINIHKNGEELPSGDNYRVITEEDLRREKENEQTGNVFDSLKDIDFGDK